MKIILPLILCILLSGCSYIDERFTEKVTGIVIPADRFDFDSNDNGETAVVMHFRLPKETGKEFLAENNFQNEHHATLEDLFYVRNLKPENQTEPEGFEPFYTYGNSESNSWLFIYDINSDRVWSVVMYPDMAGDKPMALRPKAEVKSEFHERIEKAMDKNAEPVAGGDAAR